MYAIEAIALNIHFGKTPILWDLSFKIPTKLMVGIIGPNGAGKSTLLRAILGLVKPLSGSVCVLGQKGGKVSSSIAYVPQKESIDWDFPITAFDVVLMGRYGNLGLFGRLKKADYMAASRALEQVGMSGFKDRQISELSGGQQQRLFLARALVQNPQVYLLDEPFSGIDLATEKVMIEILKNEKEKGKSIFVVHHDLSKVQDYFDWALLLNTRLVGCGPVEQVFTEEMLQKTFKGGVSLFKDVAELSLKKRGGEV